MNQSFKNQFQRYSETPLINIIPEEPFIENKSKDGKNRFDYNHNNVINYFNKYLNI